MKKILSCIFIGIAGLIVGTDSLFKAYTDGSSWASDWKLLLKGFGCIIIGILAIAGIFTYFANKREEKRKKELGKKLIEETLSSLDAFKEKYGGGEKETEEWTPEHTKPQMYDWDNGKCPYKRDGTKPLGSKENPVVAGIPESSTHLVFSKERGCWILTDGLGNGWIR